MTPITNVKIIPGRSSTAGEVESGRSVVTSSISFGCAAAKAANLSDSSFSLRARSSASAASWRLFSSLNSN